MIETPSPSNRTALLSVAMKQYVRFYFRLFRRDPLPNTITVAALAVAIGLTATMFSVLYGIFLRPLPFRDSSRIVQMDCNNVQAGIERMPLTDREYLEWKANQHSFDDIAVWYGRSALIGGSGKPAELLNGAHVSSNLFRLLAVEPTLGRTFDAREEQAEQPSIAIISDALWQRRYGRSPDILTRTIRVNGRELSIVGVMAPGFRFPLSQDVWLTLDLPPTSAGERKMGLQGVGKLREGVSLRAAQTEMSALARQMEVASTEKKGAIGIVVRRYIDAYSDKEMRSYILIMFAAVCGLFLLSCSTAASLMVSQARLRKQELAVRQAIGASRKSITAQLFFQAALLAAAGGVLGVGLAAAATSRIQQIIQPLLRSFWVDVHLDLTVTLFLVAITVLAAVLSGLVPAVHASRSDLVSPLKDLREEEGARLGWLRLGLVGLQVAFCCSLLVVTGLLLQSQRNLNTVDLGYSSVNLLVGNVSLPSASYPTAESWSRLSDRLLARLSTTPAIRSFTLASSLPTVQGTVSPIEIEGGTANAKAPTSDSTVASPEFFRTFELPLLQGRSFSEGDRPSSPPVAIVSQSFAQRWFPHADALGHRIRFQEDKAESAWLTIVGVVRDVHANPLPERQRGFLPVFDHTPVADDFSLVYLPLSQNPIRSLSVAIRSQGSSSRLIGDFRRILNEIDPDLPTVEIKTLSDSIAEHTWDYRLFTGIFTVFGLVSLGLALFGLYGTVSLSVNSRKRELGVRIALGALPSQVLRPVLATGLRQLAGGAVLGLVMSAILARGLRSLLFDVAPWDLRLFAIAMALLLAAGISACILPAQKALHVDPMDSIRGH